MKYFKVKLNKSVVVIQMLLKAFQNKADLHKIFKILYFAEQKHLVRYGCPIVGDRYIAMKDGPVPSTIYDIVKYIRGDNNYFTKSLPLAKTIFSIENRFNLVLLNDEFDKTILSESELQCLRESYKENKDLTFDEIRDKSHDLAWQSVDRDNDILIKDIAKAGGAKEEFIKYIELNIENENLVF